MRHILYINDRGEQGCNSMLYIYCTDSQFWDIVPFDVQTAQDLSFVNLFAHQHAFLKKIPSVYRLE